MTETAHGRQPGLLERLDAGPVICAEGYLFELERRGYLQAGAYVPEVVLEHPELVAQLHREFVHAGSDVVEAFTYYAHREKLRLIGKEHLLEELNRGALSIAKEVADESGALFAGDICNTNVFEPDDDSRKTVRAMFEEQVGWAVEAGVDFVIGETFSWGQEALLALDVVKQAGLPAVVTLAVHREPVTWDGWTPAEACARLEDGRRRRRGAQLHPRAGDDAAAPRVDPGAGRAATWRRCPSRTGPTTSEPSFQSLTDDACDCIPGDGRSRRPSTPWPATGTRSPSSRSRRAASGSGTSASAAAPGPITSGAWPRRSGERRPRAATRPTCPSTRTTARTRA